MGKWDVVSWLYLLFSFGAAAMASGCTFEDLETRVTGEGQQVGRGHLCVGGVVTYHRDPQGDAHVRTQFTHGLHVVFVLNNIHHCYSLVMLTRLPEISSSEISSSEISSQEISSSEISSSEISSSEISSSEISSSEISSSVITFYKTSHFL